MKTENVIVRANLEWAKNVLADSGVDKSRIVVSYFHEQSPDDLFPNPVVYSSVQSINDTAEVPYLDVGEDGAEIALSRIIEFFVVKPTEQQIKNRMSLIS